LGDNAPSLATNVTIAKIRELGIYQMPHLPYSPDIAPNDFFLFGYLKSKLQGCSYDSADKFISAITDLMENLQKSLLHRVFDELISRLHFVVESDGDYILTSQKNLAPRPVA
jgi:hypothetical protein